MTREPDFTLTKKDFRVDWFSGSGAGGQHRNKHQNCCRITHVETGITAQCVDYRDRPSNQRIAFRRLVGKLRPWLIEQTLGEQQRPDQNPEIVRTYHYADNRVKDHASKLQQSITQVEKDLSGMIEARRKKMKERT